MSEALNGTNKWNKIQHFAVILWNIVFAATDAAFNPCESNTHTYFTHRIPKTSIFYFCFMMWLSDGELRIGNIQRDLQTVL